MIKLIDAIVGLYVQHHNLLPVPEALEWHAARWAYKARLINSREYSAVLAEIPLP